MEVMINAFCLLLGIFIGFVCNCDKRITINYNKTTRDDTPQFHTLITEDKPNNKQNEDIDTREEIAQKVQEALGVFINDESEQR